MQMTVRQFNQSITGRFAEISTAGEPAVVVNGGKRGNPAEAVVVPPELWDAILRVPSVRKRIKEYAAAKQAENGLPDVA